MTPARLYQVLNHRFVHELSLLVLDIGGPFKEGFMLLPISPPLALLTSIIYATSLLLPCFMPGEADPWISLMNSLATQLPSGFVQWEIKAGNQMTGGEEVRIFLFLAPSCWFAVVGCTPPLNSCQKAFFLQLGTGNCALFPLGLSCNRLRR